MEEKFEKALADAVRRGEELEYGVFDSAMENLLVFRSGQIGLPQRKLQRRLGKCGSKHRRDRKPCKKIQ